MLDNHIKPTGFEKIQPKKKHSLTEQSLAGFFWMFSAIGIRAVSEMLVVVILARLLTQKDFGVVAAALVVIKVLIIFSQLGIGPAIVQKSHLEDRHIKAAFSLSCLFGFFLTGLIYSIAPNIADFFRMEGLTAVLRIMSLVFSIQSISLTAESLLQREMKFRALSSIEVTSFVLGFGVVGICLAFMKFGIWSLVIAHLSQVFIKTILLLIIKDHPKRVCFERDAVAELMNYGGGFTIARICNSIAGQGDNLVIGRWLGADALGLYGRAYQLMVMPATLFGMALDKVLFPAMAKIQTEQDRLKAVYKKGVALISLVILPISVMIYLLSSEIITVFFGSSWLGAVIPLKILAIGLLFRTSYKLSDSLARSTGAVYRRAWRQGVYALCVIGGAYFGSKWGLVGVSIGVVCAITVNFMLMAQLSLHLTHLRWRNFLAAHVPALPLTVVVGLQTWWLVNLLRSQHMSAFHTLLTSVLAIGLTTLLIGFVARRVFIGQDGLWMLDSLAILIKREPGGSGNE